VLKTKKPQRSTQSPRPLEPRQTRFVAEYLKDLNATQAAIRAGYSPRSAQMQSSRLLSKDIVKAAVAAGTAKQLQTADLSAKRVLEELRRLSFVDPRGFWTRKGRRRSLKPIDELSDEQAAAVASFEAIIKNAEAGDGKTDLIHKIKLWDKVRALEMLAKHFKLLTDLIQIEDTDRLLARLDEGRKRNAER
jgi:phage terminase small subunit